VIGIIDYGLGNIKAISNIYNKLKIDNIILKSSNDFEKADKLILPGVGAFDSAIRNLKENNFFEKINSLVLKKNTKILGICVGMQTFAEVSEEGSLSGLEWISGSVKKFEKNNNFRLPHMGWNSIKKLKKNILFDDIDDGEYFYFCHSYYFNCVDNNHIITETNFGSNFASSINYNNIYGIQFHPEKSHDNGIKVLKNFAKL
tara:strand:+ start:971 stop:1576 length:606 start_codon:yes stop_codon:yes gene_type:complete